ncbi:MAG TPA: hypothetical protein EYQ24_12195 [Bacteroidetes bacterium]|nr:hypothetical protein [Bacteroidota bacterium]
MTASATFFALFDQVAALACNGLDRDSDAFLAHVAPSGCASYDDPGTWSREATAEAYDSLATYAEAYGADDTADRCREAAAECREAARTFPVSREAAVETTAAERLALALASAETAATFAVYARQPHERFDPRRNEVVADGLTMDAAGEVAARLRAEVPDLVYTVSAAPLAAQLARAADRLAETRRAVAGKGRAVRAGLDFDPATAGDSGTFPALAREEAIRADEADLFAHVSASGSRFDVRGKLADSVTFSRGRGGASLAVPSKLRGTKGLAPRVARLAADVELWGGGSVYLPTVLHVLPEGVEGGPGVAVLAAPSGTRRDAYLVGYLQDKHARWLAPLLNPTAAGTVTDEGTPIRVYVTAVTGGTTEKPTRGVNVVITRAADAVRSMWAETAREGAEADAYESGDRTRIEALMD